MTNHETADSHCVQSLLPEDHESRLQDIALLAEVLCLSDEEMSTYRSESMSIQSIGMTDYEDRIK